MGIKKLKILKEYFRFIIEIQFTNNINLEIKETWEEESRVHIGIQFKNNWNSKLKIRNTYRKKGLESIWE